MMFAVTGLPDRMVWSWPLPLTVTPTVLVLPLTVSVTVQTDPAGMSS